MNENLVYSGPSLEYHVIDVGPDRLASDLLTFRKGYWINWAKVIVLGRNCFGDSSQTLEDAWSGGQPDLISLDLIGKNNEYI